MCYKIETMFLERMYVQKVRVPDKGFSATSLIHRMAENQRTRCPQHRAGQDDRCEM